MVERRNIKENGAEKLEMKERILMTRTSYSILKEEIKDDESERS